MGFDVNVLVMGGRLVKDPISRYTSNETAVTNFRLACGTGQDKALFIDVTVWGKQAETTNQYLSKGSQVIVTGYLDEDSWVADDGTKKTRLKIVARSVQFVGGKKDGGQTNEKPDGSGDIDDIVEGFEEEEFPL